MPAVPHHDLVRPIRTEVLIVGAGISGAMAAEALAADGHDVVVVDRRGPLRGSTAATTALVQYEIDEPVIALNRKIGTQRAGRAWRRAHQAVQNLAARIGELGIACDLERRDSLYLAGNTLSAAELGRECAARRLAGIETQYLTARILETRYGIEGRDGALLSFNNLELDPMRLTAGLLKAAVAKGARIYSPVEVTGFENHRREMMVATSGPTIACERLIFCTGYETPRMVPQSRHRIISTFALATRPQPRRLWPDRVFIWEASDPYLYMRTTPDGRVICGGEDGQFADDERRDSLLPEKIDTIRRKLSRLFPKLDTTPEFTWTANFGTTATGLPFIGSLPGQPHVFALMGYGGNGIAYSRIGAELLRAALAGTLDPDADLFAFHED